jgi:hypothetical protein
MVLLAPAIIGLKGSFHGRLSPRNNGRATISQGARRVKPRRSCSVLAYSNGPLAAPSASPTTDDGGR